MRHRHSNRILGRTANHRAGLLRNLTHDLLAHGSITTTEARAKELKKHIEQLITAARGELTLHRRRKLISQLGHTDSLSNLTDRAKQYADRPGGYTRLTKLPTQRQDSAPMARIDFVEENAK